MFTTAETSDLLVIDCRAASADSFIDFFDEVNFAEILRSLGARLTVISHVKVDWPILTNLRLDPFERTGMFNGKDNDLSFIPGGRVLALRLVQQEIGEICPDFHRIPADARGREFQPVGAESQTR